jgi:hypothetical protein
MVYVIQEQAGKNLLPAAKFGELNILLPSSMQITSETDSDSIINELGRKLADFGDEDYLLLIGDPILIGIATALACHINGIVKFLKWDKQEHVYYPVYTDFR